MNIQPPPTRCKDCTWIHEAAFRGVELCAKHVHAVNSYEALLEVAKQAETMLYGHLESARYEAEKKLGSLLINLPAILKHAVCEVHL